MSIFSGKTKKIYSAYATRLYKEMPPVAKQTVIGSIANNRNIAEDLVSNIGNGILFRANQFYRYAANGKYEWGLPTDKIEYTPVGVRENVRIVLEALLSVKVYVSTVDVTPDDYNHYTYTVQYSTYMPDGTLSPDLIDWVYVTTSGLYPTLDITGIEGASPYYPIIPIRVDSVNIGEDTEYEHYQDIKTGCRMLDIDINNLYGSINSQLEDSGDNPPEDMYIVLATSISRDTPRTKEYLYRFFEKMDVSSVVKEIDFLKWKANHNQYDTVPPTNTLTISDSNFNGSLSWDFIRREVITGSVCEVNKYHVEYSKGVGRYVGQYGDTYSESGVYVSYQVSATQYISYFIQGLVYRNLVIGKGWVTHDLEDAFEDPDGAADGECFLVPLRKDICREMGSIRTHDLMYDSIRLLTCDFFKYKTKWYQTGFFKAFIAVVALIIAIWFPPAAGVVAWSAAAVGYALAYMIVGMLVMPLIMKAATDVFGEKIGLILAVVAVLYGVGFDFSSSASSLVTTTGVTTFTVYSALLTATTGIVGLKSMDIAKEMEGIQEEADELEVLMKELYKEEFKSALDTSTTLNNISNDPYSIMGATDYVAMTQMYVQKPLYLTYTTEAFNTLALMTDRPDSYIRLGI